MVNALVLCSGGLDSVTLAHYVKKKLKYDKINILFFNYGQRTFKQEEKASKLCAKQIGAKFIEINLPWLGKISGSLINSEKKSKKIKREDLKDSSKESTNWYVPCRNLIFLTSALSLAEAEYVKNKKKTDIFIGLKNEGKEAYPDATPEFLEKVNKLSQTTCAAPFKVKAPLIKKDKEDIIKLGISLGIKYEDTFTCYVGAGEMHCGSCLSCRLRQEGFYWAGINDPTKYKEKMKDFRLAGK